MTEQNARPKPTPEYWALIEYRLLGQGAEAWRRCCETYGTPDTPQAWAQQLADQHGTNVGDEYRVSLFLGTSRAGAITHTAFFPQSIAADDIGLLTNAVAASEPAQSVTSVEDDAELGQATGITPEEHSSAATVSEADVTETVAAQDNPAEGEDTPKEPTSVRVLLTDEESEMVASWFTDLLHRAREGRAQQAEQQLQDAGRALNNAIFDGQTQCDAQHPGTKWNECEVACTRVAVAAAAFVNALLVFKTTAR